MSKYKLKRLGSHYDNGNRCQFRILKKGLIFYHDVGAVYAETKAKAEALAREYLTKPRFSESNIHRFTL